MFWVTILYRYNTGYPVLYSEDGLPWTTISLQIRSDPDPLFFYKGCNSYPDFPARGVWSGFSLIVVTGFTQSVGSHCIRSVRSGLTRSVGSSFILSFGSGFTLSVGSGFSLSVGSSFSLSVGSGYPKCRIWLYAKCQIRFYQTCPIRFYPNFWIWSYQPNSDTRKKIWNVNLTSGSFILKHFIRIRNSGPHSNAIFHPAHEIYTSILVLYCTGRVIA